VEGYSRCDWRLLQGGTAVVFWGGGIKREASEGCFIFLTKDASPLGDSAVRLDMKEVSRIRFGGGGRMA